MGAAYLGNSRFAPQPKENAWRSESYRRMVAACPCEHCGYAGGQQAAHADMNKGKSIKSDDRTCFALCVPRGGRSPRIGCHALFGDTGKIPKELRRTLELSYACRTIRRFEIAGTLPADFVLPDWYVNERRET